MNFKKSLFSFLLLFAYSVGFAHNIVPHYHIGEAHSNEDHSAIHQHVDSGNHDAHDIEHNSHLDDSFYDYIVCILSQSEHPAHDSSVYLLQANDNLQDRIENSPFLIPEVKICFTFYSFKEKSQIQSSPFLNNSTLHNFQQSKRGPPQFS